MNVLLLPNIKKKTGLKKSQLEITFLLKSYGEKEDRECCNIDNTENTVVQEVQYTPFGDRRYECLLQPTSPSSPRVSQGRGTERHGTWSKQ